MLYDIIYTDNLLNCGWKKREITSAVSLSSNGGNFSAYNFMAFTNTNSKSSGKHWFPFKIPMLPVNKNNLLTFFAIYGLVEQIWSVAFYDKFDNQNWARGHPLWHTFHQTSNIITNKPSITTTIAEWCGTCNTWLFGIW